MVVINNVNLRENHHSQQQQMLMLRSHLFIFRAMQLQFCMQYGQKLACFQCKTWLNSEQLILIWKDTLLL